MGFVLFFGGLALSLFSIHTSAEETESNRQVIQGNLLYTATAFATTEMRAVFLAEARAAWMLSIECGAPPSDTLIYRQDVSRLSNGTFTARVQAGTTFGDCEAVRKATGGIRERLSHARLSRIVTDYENIRVGSEPGADLPKTLAVLTPGRSRDPIIVLTDEQEMEELRSLQRRTNARLRERDAWR